MQVLLRRLTGVGAMLVAFTLCGAPASAQTGMVKGKVIDAKSQPVEGAKITIDFQDGVNRQFVTKTNKKGEFIQIGLMSGPYKVTADKDGLAQTFSAQVRLSQASEVNFQLTPGQAGGAPMSKEEAAKLEKLKLAFDAAVAANQAGNYDEAIAKLNEALVMKPNCPSCYLSIAYAHSRKKEYDQAEASLKKAIELKPDYADAYNELATLYNTQKKFDLAASASAEAAKFAGAGAAAGGGANPDILYNQGVIMWNAGKIPEAKKNFEEVVRLNPNHADAHYQLGMANLNEQKMPEAAAEFETYLKLAPTGQFADQAKLILGQIKK